MKRTLIAALAVLAAACGDKKTSVSVSAQTSVAEGDQPATTIQSGEVTISRLRMVIRRLELETTYSDDHVDDSHGDDTAELRRGPFVLDLSGEELDGAIHEVFDAEVPPGTYREIEFRIQKLMGDERVGDPDFDGRDASIIVDGTLSDGTPYRFRTALDDEQELEGRFVVDEGSNNVTLSIAPSTWFAGLTDLAALKADEGGTRSRIEEQIKSSIDSMDCHDDDDRDGRDDHGEDHHSHTR